MGLVTGAYMKAQIVFPGINIDDFILLMDSNKKEKEPLLRVKRGSFSMHTLNKSNYNI